MAPCIHRIFALSAPWLGARHLQHRVGRVDGVGTVDMIDQAERNFSRAASGVEQDSGMPAHQLQQRVVHFGRVGRAKQIIRRHPLGGKAAPEGDAVGSSLTAFQFHHQTFVEH